MHRGIATSLLLLSLACACGERRPKPPTTVGGLQPAPPPPPGSIAVVGPLRVESIDVVRSEIGWDRDLVRASRIVDYDVVLAQERATCPKERVGTPTQDTFGCSGLVTLPEVCTRETIRARLELSLRRTIDVQQRCVGDASPYAIPASGDPRSALQNAGSACFRNKNKFKPEATWTSLYALTELSIDEKIVEAKTRFPFLVVELLDADAHANIPELGAPTAMFCREDGAFLDGTPGALPSTMKLPMEKLVPPLVSLIEARAPLSGQDKNVAATGQTWRAEQELWEQCRAPEVKDALVSQERCQLLRQLDRFLRDVEDAARPETPKGAASATPSASASTKKGAP
jgi:hypothetical protein